MSIQSIVTAIVVLGLALMAGPVEAEHRATFLGHPAHRFAPPLKRSEDLRQLLLNDALRADIESILNQAGWKGDIEDLIRAAASADIVEWRIPVGGRMPFMSSRKKGKPIALIDVLWVGKEPIEAFAFPFSSKGQKYRLVTPKPCSNFFVEDLGPETPPVPPAKLELALNVAASGNVCEPIELEATVRNTGGSPLTQVRLTETLPDGLRLIDDKATLTIDVGDLPPRSGRIYRAYLKASARGTYPHLAKVTSAEGLAAEATARTLVLAPDLTLTCTAPEEIHPGRPAKVCLTLTNRGDAAEPGAVVSLLVPNGASFQSATEGGELVGDLVVWRNLALAPTAATSFCATFTVAQLGAVNFSAAAVGTCAPQVATQCDAKVSGLAAILLEVADIEDPISVGSQEIYEIKVTNQGSAPGTEVSIVCELEDTQSFISATGTTPVRAEGATLTMQTLPRLEPKAAASWRVTVNAAKAGDVRFHVRLTSDQLTQPVRETEATRQF
ncbi:MAG: hypothetical protein JNN07_10180 [Verrucomicrobiales bacterium]|nr:hypothetical protein [Verrucomicrobiales bacterium]